MSWLIEAGHDASCVMLAFPEDLAQEIREWGQAHIPKEWLAPDEKGYEDKVHVTLLYGIQTPDLDEVEPHLPRDPIPVQLGKVKKFTSAPEHDVLYVEVIGPGLKTWHDRLVKSLEVKETHKDYRPHATLAYVQKGMGDELVGQDPFEGVEFDLDTIVWSPKGGEDEDHVHIEMAVGV